MLRAAGLYRRLKALGASDAAAVVPGRMPTTPCPAGCATAARVLAVVGKADLAGYWLHLDVDVLDPSVMPAVDSPDPGGLGADQLAAILDALAAGAAGIQVTVFDSDLDPDGRYARLLVDVIVAGLARMTSSALDGGQEGAVLVQA